MTSRSTIRGWFYTGAEDGYDYLLVVCDDFDYQDFPVFCHRREVFDTLAHHQNQQMSTVMEVYDLHLGMEEQIAQDRAWNIPEMR